MLKSRHVLSVILAILCASFSFYPSNAFMADQIIWYRGSYYRDDGYTIFNPCQSIKSTELSGCSVDWMPEITGEKQQPNDNGSDSNDLLKRYRSEWMDLQKNSPLILVVSGFTIGEQCMFIRMPEDADKKIVTSVSQSVSVCPAYEEYELGDDAFFRGGFSVWKTKIKQIIRNDTGRVLHTDDVIKVKEDFYVHNGVIYTKLGSKQNPMSSDDTLVFASIVPEDEQTPLYMFNNDFRIRLNPDNQSEGRNSLLHADEKLIADYFGYEILKYFDIDTSAYQNPNDRIAIPAAIGFGAGALVCLVPTAVVLLVKAKKRKKAAAAAADGGQERH